MRATSSGPSLIVGTGSTGDSFELGILWSMYGKKVGQAKQRFDSLLELALRRNLRI
jgi:hypothetical protein